MEILLYFLYLFLFFYSTFIIGHSLIKKINCKSSFFLDFITGISLTLIISNFLYFFLNRNLLEILIFLSLFSIFCIFYFKSLFLKNFFTYNLFFITIVLFLATALALFYGEQFYVFRGNYYDHTWYVSNSLLIKKFQFSEINNYFHNNNLFFVIQNLHRNLYERPASALFMSFFIFPSFIDIYLSAYIFKIFLVSLSGLSFLYFIRFYTRYNSCKKLFLFLFFCFSFWTLYIFEIDALSQLFFFIYFIFLIKFFTSIYVDSKLNLKRSIIFIINLSAAFLIYPQQFLILILIFVIYFLVSIKKDLFIFINNNYKKILLLFSLFILLTIWHYKSTYLDYYNTYLLSTMQVDWWGYYGGFVLGRDSLVTQRGYVEIIKNLIVNHQNIISLILNIIYDHFNHQYYFILFNIPVSLFGLYFLTPGEGLNLVNIFLLILCCFLIHFISKNIFHNITIFFHRFSSKLKYIFFSAFCSFCIIFLLNLINIRIWQLVKLYFFFSIFLIVLIIFKFYVKRNKIYFKINYLLILFFLLFPFYKYSVFNSGIARYDGFPSIINVNQKKLVSWNFSVKNLKSCNNIYIYEKNMDEINRRYIYAKLINSDLRFYILNKNLIFEKNDCQIKLKNGIFGTINY